MQNKQQLSAHLENEQTIIKNKVILRLSIPLFILISLGSAWYLYVHSPRYVDSAVSGILIGNIGEWVDDRFVYDPHVRISGNELSCPNGRVGAEVYCTVQFEGKRLETTVYYLSDTTQSIGTCTAEYDGRSIPCQVTYTLVHRTPYVIIKDTLGVSPARLQILRLQNWLLHMNEAQWITLARLMAMALALLTAVLLWRQFKKSELAKRALISLITSVAVWGTLYTCISLTLLYWGYID